MNTNEFNWKDIEVSKSRERENFDNLVEGKFPQYRDANIESIRNRDTHKKGVYSFNKYQEDTRIKDHHLDTTEFLEGLNFVDPEESLDVLEPEDFDEDAIFNEAAHIDASHLSNEEKMRLWMEGKRGFNYQAASNDKLIQNYKICKKLKFSKGIMLIWGELKDRGLLDKVIAN